MKLAYLHQYFAFPDENGGTRSYDLSKEFIKKGINVEVITSTSDQKYKGRRWTMIEREGIKVHYLFLPYDNSMSYLERIIVFLKFLFFSTFKLLNVKCDVVLATSTPLTIGIPALFKKWFGRTPYIFEVRDVWPEAVVAIGAINNVFLVRCLYLLEKTIYKSADCIVPLSVDMKDSIVTRFPKFKTKTEIVIENISEIERFKKDDILIDFNEKFGFVPRFSVLYAGAFGKVNGVGKIVELASLTKKIDPSVCFFIIGEGAEKKEVIELAKVKEVLDINVFILDSISKNELPIWYNSISMGSSFVIDIPELWRNSANKFFDTLAAKRPILINHEGWQAKLIRKENIGYVLPTVITEKEAELFVDYTKNNELYKAQCDQAFKVANREFSLEVAVSKYLSIINKY